MREDQLTTSISRHLPFPKFIVFQVEFVGIQILFSFVFFLCLFVQ